MLITAVNIKKIDDNVSRKKAIATIVLDNCFAIHDIKIIQGDRDLFIAMPSRKKADGSYKDIAHPITAEARELIEKTIIEAYNNQLEEIK